MFACSLVADKTKYSSELSKCKQRKSIQKVMPTLVMPWLRHIFHVKTKGIAIFVLLCKFRSFNHSSFLIILHVCIGIHVDYVRACVALFAMTLFTASFGSSLIVC